MPLVYNEANLRHCVGITIIDDSIVENQENGIIFLTTTENRVRVDTSGFVIIDDDSKQY